MFQKVARIHPFWWLGGLTIAIMAIGPFVPLDYDDRSLGTVWFVFTYAVTVVFRKVAVVSTALVGRETGALHTILTLLLGSVLYVAADLALNMSAKRLAKNEAEPATQGD